MVPWVPISDRDSTPPMIRSRQWPSPHDPKTWDGPHAIGYQHGQPPNNGGNCFAFDARTRRLHCGWKAIDGPSPQRSPRAMWVAAGKKISE
jgi:hypothetical protein